MAQINKDVQTELDLIYIKHGINGLIEGVADWIEEKTKDDTASDKLKMIEGSEEATELARQAHAGHICTADLRRYAELMRYE